MVHHLTLRLPTGGQSYFTTILTGIATFSGAIFLTPERTFVSGTLPGLVPSPPRHLSGRGGRGGRAERLPHVAPPAGVDTTTRLPTLGPAGRPEGPDDGAEEAKAENRPPQFGAQPDELGQRGRGAFRRLRGQLQPARSRHGRGQLNLQFVSQVKIFVY